MTTALRIITLLLGVSALSSFGHAVPLLYKRFNDPLLATVPIEGIEWVLYLLPFVLLVCAGVSLLLLRRRSRKSAA